MKKILLITNHDPLSTGYGAGQRTNQIWTALKSIGKTDIAWLTESEKDVISQYEIDGDRFTKIECKPEAISDHWWNALQSRKISESFYQCFDLSNYDIIVSRYITPAMKLSLQKTNTLLIDFDDPVYHFPHSALKAPKRFLKEVVRLINQQLVNWKIRHTILGNAHFLFINSRDRNSFPFLNGSLLPNIPYIPEMIAPRTFRKLENPTIIFIGLMSYQPNIEAVDYFLTRIWPEILKECPKATFRIVGKADPKERDRWQNHPSCVVEGFVKDLAEVYASASLAVSPILSGGGSNIKIPEACAYGCPIVTTRYAYSGWSDYLVENEHILVADSVSDFIEKCISIITDNSLSIRISEQAMLQVNKSISKSAFTNTLIESLNSAYDNNNMS